MGQSIHADYLGCYGFKESLTKEIDSLAEGSILFTQGISRTLDVHQAVSSLFTSKELDSNKGLGIPEKTRTLAEILKQRGYQTAGFSSNPDISKRLGFGQGFDIFATTKNPLLYSIQTMEPVKAWLNFIDRDRPFFLYLHLMDAHRPYRCTQDDIQSLKHLFLADNDIKFTKEAYSNMDPNLKKSCLDCLSEDMQSISSLRSCYAAGIRKFDARLGVILRYFRKQGFLDNSILVFVSNGEENLLNDENSKNKALSPLIIKLPRNKKGGTKVNHPANLIDILPTLLDLAGINHESSPITGENLSEWIFK